MLAGAYQVIVIPTNPFQAIIGRLLASGFGFLKFGRWLLCTPLLRVGTTVLLIEVESSFVQSLTPVDAILSLKA